MSQPMLDDRAGAGAAMVASPPLQPGLGAAGLGALTSRWVTAAEWPSLEVDWLRFEREASPNAFLSPSFALAARAVDPAPGLGALVVMRDGAWIGFVAGRPAMGGAVFAIWTHPYAPCGAPLIRRGEEAAVIAVLFAFLAERGAAALDWPMLDEGPVATALEAAIRDREVHVLDAHRRAVLTGAPPALSKDHRRLLRRLGEMGEVHFTSTADGGDLRGAMAGFLALEAQGWKGRNGTALASDAATRQLFEQGVGALAAIGRARIDTLLLDGRPVASGVVLMSGARAWYWKTAYDEALARFSPGLLLSHAVGTAAIAVPGIALVDSCAISGHPMIDRIWPERMAMTGRFIAVACGTPGWRYRVALAVRQGLAAAKACAKRLLKR